MSTVEDERVTDTVRRLRSAQKTSKGAPAYSRFVNRPAGRVFAAVSFHVGATPNRVTGLSAIFSLAGILVIAVARPTVTVGIVVMVALAVGYALDSADGQLARLRGGGTAVGEWLDHVVDAAKICALHLAVLVSFYRFGPSTRGVELLIPLVWTFVSSVLFFVIILNDQIRRAHGTASAQAGPASVVRSLLVAPTDYGVLLLTFGFFGVHSVFIWIYGLQLLANILYLVLALTRWFREFSRLG